MEVDKDNKPTSRWIIRNILLAIAFFAVLLVLTQMGLKAITRHNQVIIVPDLTGLSVADAKIVAKRNHIRTEVVDSVYVKRIEKGNVFSQNPAAGKEVKKDRVIKLTINAHQTKMVKMPNLVGYSLRQAKTEILSSGLSVGKLAYREDIATNNVLDQFIKGRFSSRQADPCPLSLFSAQGFPRPRLCETFAHLLSGRKIDNPPGID